MVLLGAFAFVPGWLAAAAAATATGGATVPDRLHDPWLWQATVGQRPVGPATVLFFTDRTRYFESTGVMISRTGGYRLIPKNIGEGQGVLSPDGHRYLRPGTGVVVDLVTGAERRIGPAGLRPLAWSPDGTALLATRDNDENVITYGPDNQPVNDPEKPDDLILVDPSTGANRVVPVGGFASHAAASWSPDGALIAVTGPADPLPGARQWLVVTDPMTGAVRFSRELAEGQRLAGRAAWSPDGQRIAVLGYDGCPGERCAAEAVAARRWWIGFLDARTGTPSGARLPVDGWPKELIGWREQIDPVLTQVPQGENRTEGSHTVVIAVPTHGAPQMLVDTPVGVTGIEVPNALLARSAFGGLARRPSVFAAPAWIYLTVAAAVLLSTVGMAHRRRTARRRLTGEPAGGPPDPLVR